MSQIPLPRPANHGKVVTWSVRRFDMIECVVRGVAMLQTEADVSTRRWSVSFVCSKDASADMIPHIRADLQRVIDGDAVLHRLVYLMIWVNDKPLNVYQAILGQTKRGN